MPDVEPIRYHCNYCGHETKHDLVIKREIEECPEGNLIGTDTYEMLECRGCEAISVRHTNWFAPQDELTVFNYPPRVSRRPPNWRWKLPPNVRELLDEVYVCLQNDGRRVALMGARALLDLVMLDQVGDTGTFAERLTGLEKQGVIGSRSRGVLAIALDAGSAASHRGYQASAEELNSVMDIIENLLQAVYHLPVLAEKIKKAAPPREPKTGS